MDQETAEAMILALDFLAATIEAQIIFFIFLTGAMSGMAMIIGTKQ